MKRLHIHLAVENLKQSIDFYTTLFASSPTVQHDDYAKWMLDDPRVNFAISNRSKKIGLDHLGIQAEDDSELLSIKQNLEATQVPIKTQEQTSCCYSRSNKHWVTDPQGIAWESFHSLNKIPTFNEDDSLETKKTDDKKSSSCCR
ncbi:MAG: ArsI/CadI family heavy metal resistance metalloenzyme [Methylococcales bacterium]|nr:ArsI/CadI family heavy metal resistance metalloenzyme [Methylococcales bacterium]